MQQYCSKWNLCVNENKTKITIKVKHDRYNFLYNGKQLEIVDNFKYLGIILNYNGSFKLAIQELKSQASRAMYSLIGKCRRLDLPIDLQLHLFDATVLPIMLYGCEIWGSENYVELDRLHLKFLKHVLGVNGRTKAGPTN